MYIYVYVIHVYIYIYIYTYILYSAGSQSRFSIDLVIFRFCAASFVRSSQRYEVRAELHTRHAPCKQGKHVAWDSVWNISHTFDLDILSVCFGYFCMFSVWILVLLSWP